MRNTALALLLVLSGTLTPARAGLLTRGNIFADGLAGCAIGATVGLIGGVLLAAPLRVVEDTVAIATGIPIPHISVLGGCLTGVAITVAINGIIHFAGLNQDVLDSHRPLESVTDMVYPPTPGKAP
jgi:hypothetical protein